MAALSRPLRVVVQPGGLADALRSSAADTIELIQAPTLREDDVAPLLADADVWISSQFTAGMGRDARQLRLVQCTGAGTNLIDIQAVPPTATVCNADGHAAGVTEYAFMVMSALQRDLLGMHGRIRAGDWREHRSGPQPELRGRTLAIIGLGLIGAELARIGRAFGMRVTAVTNTPDQERARELELDYLGAVTDLHRVLAEADFVVVAVPLNEKTTGLIGTNELNAMRTDAYLINVARGPVVEEAALYQALRDRAIAGAAIDVWYRYPRGDESLLPSEYPFHELDNVIMTPHVAGWTEGTLRIRIEQVTENLRRLAAGEPLLNIVVPARSVESVEVRGDAQNVVDA